MPSITPELVATVDVLKSFLHERGYLARDFDLAEWIDLLFSWVKFFHIGDFAWHRSEPLPIPGVLAFGTLAIAWVGRHRRFREWGWIVYPLLFGIGLKMIGQEVTVDRGDIVKQEQLPISMMPEGLLQSLTAQEAADLLAFLGSLK